MNAMIPNQLFVRDDDSNKELGELLKIDKIAIRRNNRGTWESIPQAYNTAECASEEQLYAIVGPGLYELIGRAESGQIVRKTRLTLADMGDGPSEPEQTAPQAPAAVVDPNAMVMAGGSPVERMMMMMMMQSREQAQQQAQQSAQQFTAMIQLNSQQTQAMTGLLGAVLSAKNEGGITAELLGKLLETRNSSDPQTAFLQGVQTVADLNAGKKTADAEAEKGGNSLEETMKVIGQCFEMYQAFTSQGMPNAEAQQRAISGVTGGAL